MITRILFVGCALWTQMSFVSCKTSRPVASRLREEVPAQTQEPDILPSGTKSEVLQWVVVNQGTAPLAEGEFAWDIDLRTGMEIWCERLCSEFVLLENTGSGVTNLVAVKKTIPGNTKPGMLNLKKTIHGSRAEVKKIRVVNVGAIGQSVVLEDVITKDRPNFYAVPMMLSRSGSEENPVLFGEFIGKRIALRVESGAEMPAVIKDAEPVAAFVMGSLIKENSPDGKQSEVFIASKIIFPWNVE